MRVRFSIWMAASASACFLVLLPLAVIAFMAAGESGEVWRHLAETVLARYAANTAVLLAGVGGLTLTIGVTAAGLAAFYDFPGRRFLSWALVLPLSTPTYIAGFAYAGVFGYTGLLQQIFGGLAERPVITYLPFNFLSLGGIIFVMSFVLYPYVYLATRASFMLQSAATVETARLLGRSPARAFLTVALPISRPAAAAGVTLAVLEALNDYGAVSYYGVDTLTTGIFRAWLSMGDLDAAVRLSGLLMAGVLAMTWFERRHRGRARFDESSRQYRPVARTRLSGFPAFLATATASLPFFFGFVLPGTQLSVWAYQTWGGPAARDLGGPLLNSLMLAGASSLTVVVLALLVSYTARLHKNAFMRAISALAVVGYSIPAAVIAVGIMIPMAALDNWIDAGMRERFGIATGLILSGTIIAVGFAYAVRYIAVGFGPLRAGFARVNSSFDDVARTLGAGPLRTLIRVHLPLVRPAIVAAALLVFVDVMKELPLTLILRPFNFHTLSTKAFEWAGIEMVSHASHAAIAIVAAGLIPVFWLNRLTAGRIQ